MTVAIVMQAFIVLFTGLLAVATVTDIASLRIPNWISVAIAGLFVAAAALEPHPLMWWGSHLAAGSVVLIVGVGIFAWGKIGGGDVKLLAAVALWFGLAPLPSLLLAIGVAGGLVAIVCLILRGSWSGACLELLGVRAVSLQKGKGVPYAVAIASGSCLMINNLMS